MRGKFCISLSVLLMSTLIGVGTAVAQTKDKPVVLKGVSCFPTNNPSTIIFKMYAEAVDKASNGMLKIDIKGGPEAIAARDQIAALAKGTIDISQSTASNAAPAVPEALCLFISGNDATENRKNGFFDAYDGYYAAKGLKFISHDGDGMVFNIFTKKPVAKMADFKGLILRSNLNYDAFFKALGCSIVSLAPTELFNAMQSGIIDGYGVPVAAMPTYGLMDLTKFYVQHGLWNGAALIAMNLNSYNKLPPNLQKLLKDVTIAQEETTRKFWHDEKAKAEEQLKKANIQFVGFSAEEAKTYIELSKQSCWDDFIATNPVSGPILKKAAMASSR